MYSTYLEALNTAQTARTLLIYANTGQTSTIIVMPQTLSLTAVLLILTTLLSFLAAALAVPPTSPEELATASLARSFVLPLKFTNTTDLGALLNPRDEPDFIETLRGWQSPYNGPYCVRNDRTWATCQVATRVSDDGRRLEVWAYDNLCNQIGHSNEPSVPLEEYPLHADLKYVINVHQKDASTPPSVNYGVRHGGWPEIAWCWNTGFSSSEPGFRLACVVPFGCKGGVEDKVGR